MPDRLSASDLRILRDALNTLTALAVGPEHSKLQNVLENRDSQAEEVLNLVPPAALSLLITLTSPDAFRDLLDTVPPAEQSELKRVHQLVNDHLLPLREHPAIVEMMKSVMQPPTHTTPSADLPTNRVANIILAAFFTGQPPNLIPGVRIGFVSEDKRLVYDGHLSWRDILQLAGSLLSLIAEDFDRTTALAKAGMINRSLWPFLRSAVKAIRADLDRIEKATEQHESLSPSTTAPSPSQPDSTST